MAGGLVTVFGGSGFVGKYVVRALARAGWRVRVAMRRPHLGHELRVMGDVGQIQLVQANVRDAASVARALDGADAAINLVAILFEKGRQTFESTVATGGANVAQGCAASGIQRLIHISAIGADPASASAYGRTKGAAEAAVRAAVPSATILRPSVVFGPEDDFLNRFAQMARFSPALPLIGGGRTRFQPVYVGDVAKAAVAALDPARGAAGRTYELGGPGILTFEDILRFITREIERPRFLAPLPFAVAKPLGSVMDAVFRLNPFGGPPLTGDQVEMLRSDNVVSDDMPGLADLGVTTPESLESVAPAYLYRYKPYGQFQVRRRPA
jgi:uncharacterized protein YbjT (DUF2867 family)